MEWTAKWVKNGWRTSSFFLWAASSHLCVSEHGAFIQHYTVTHLKNITAILFLARQLENILNFAEKACLIHPSGWKITDTWNLKQKMTSILQIERTQISKRTRDLIFRPQHGEFESVLEWANTKSSAKIYYIDLLTPICIHTLSSTLQRAL